MKPSKQLDNIGSASERREPNGNVPMERTLLRQWATENYRQYNSQCVVLMCQGQREHIFVIYFVMTIHNKFNVHLLLYVDNSYVDIIEPLPLWFLNMRTTMCFSTNIIELGCCSQEIYHLASIALLWQIQLSSLIETQQHCYTYISVEYRSYSRKTNIIKKVIYSPSICDRKIYWSFIILIEFGQVISRNN